jgi:TP901 family phage tail tape measure protein
VEQIGLEAVFDLDKFDKGIAGYLNGLDKADGATQSMGGKFGKAFDDMGSSVLKVAGLMSGALVAGTVAAGAAIVGFAANGINKAADLESKMGGIASIMGETKDAIEPLKDLILDLGMDPNLKVDATEAADAIEKLASNGLTMTQIMDGAAKSTVLLANATGADFDTAAAVATDSMALFNIGAADMQKAVNGITGVTVASKFDINDYKMALAQAGGVASASGVEMEDFNATIAGISNYFAAGADAGTSYKTMLLRLNPQTDEAASAMQALGLEFFDANGNMKSMAEVSTELNDAFAKEITTTSTVSNLTDEQAARKKKLEQTISSLTGKLADYQSGIAGVSQSENDKAVSVDRLNRQLVAAQNEYAGLASIQGTTTSTTRKLTEEEKTHYLNVIFGTDAMRAAVAMSEQGEVAYTDLGVAAQELGVSIEELTQYADGGITKFEAMLVTIGKTDAVESAKVRMDNFKGSMEILQGVIDTVALKIGFAFLPMLKNMADNLSNFISNHADQIVMFFENFAGAVDAFVSGAPGDFPWEDIFPPWLAATMYTVSELVEGISIALADFNAGAMGLDYPWEDIFPAWLAATIYFVTENVDAFTGALGGVAALLASAGIAAAISGIAAALAGLLSPMVLIVAGAASLGAAWNSNFLGMKDATFAAITAITSAFEPLTTAIQEFGSGAITEIVNFVTGNQTEFTNLKAIWDGAVSSVQNLFTSIVTAVTTNLPLWQAQLVEWGAAAWGWIVEASGIAATKIGEWATALLGALASNLPTIIATLIEWSAALVTWIADAIAGGITMLGTWASAIVGWITGEGKTQIGGGALMLVGALIDWITTDLIPKVAPALGEFSAALAGGIVKIAAALGVDAVKIATAIVDAIMKTDYKKIGTDILMLIRDGWNATVETVTTVVKTFVDGIKIKFTEIDWKAVGTLVLTYIKDGFSAVVGAAVTVITTFVGNIKLKFTEIDWKALGSSILTFIKDGITAIAPGVLTSLSTIVTSMKDKFSDTVNSWTATGKDILEKVRTGIESAKATALTTITTIVADMKQRYVTPDGFAWRTIGGDISNAIRDGLQTVARAAGGILAAVVNVATYIKDQFTDQSWDEIGKTIIDGIKDGVDAAAKAAGGLLTTVKNMGLDLMKSFTEIDFEEVGRNMARFLKDGFKALAEAAGGLLPTAKSAGQGVLDAFDNIDWLALGKRILDGILTGVKAIAYGAGGLIYIVAEIVKGFTEELFGVDWNEQGQKIIQNIQAGIEAAKSKFMEIVKSIPTGIKQIFTDMTQQFKDIGTAIVNGIGSGITGAKDALMEKAQALANSLPGWVKSVLGISSPSKVFAEIGRNIVQGLIAGIDDTTGELNKVISALFGGLSGDQIGAVNINVSDQFAQRAEDIIKPIQQQLEAMESLNDLEATRLGLMHKIGVAQEGITDSSQLPTETLDQIAKWTEELETANQSIATRLKLQRDLESLQGLDSSVQELRARQDSISLLEDYLSLLESAGTLGIDISRYDVIPGDTVGTLQSMVDLESKIAIIRNEQLKLQSTGLRQTLQERKALQERELAEKKLAEDRANGLKIAMQQLQPLIDSLSISTTYGKKYQASVLDPILAKLKDVAEVEGERSRLVAEYYQSSKQLQSLQYFQNEVSDFSTRIDLLKQAADLGIDISGYAVSYDNSINGLMEMVALEEKVARAKITQLQTQGGLIKQEQARVNGLRLAMDQLSGAMGAVGAVSAAFAQRLKAQYLDPIIEKLQTAAGIDSERVRLVNEYLSASQQFASLRFFEADAARMGDYVSLLSEAKDLGIDISNTPNFIGTDKDSLLKVVKLEEEVAKARFAQLVAQAGQIRQQQQLTAALKPWVDAVNRVETYNDHLSEQLGLMKKAEGLGMNLLDVWNRYITFDPNDQKRVLEFQQKIAEASRQDLMNQMTGMIAEQKRVKGLESALSQLQPLIDQTNVSSAFGQKYKAEVLDPMLRALEKSAGIDSERLRLMNEYTAAAQKLIEINKKEGQLDFLKQQLDVIKMIKDQDLVGGNSLFDGIAFGVNASIDDLLTLTNRVLNAMITEVKDELGIHSPSQVFADIGGQMMAGLQQGIQKGFMQPLNALRQGTVAHGSMSTRTLNFAMGGVTINTPMDEVMFESRVLRILERSMN